MNKIYESARETDAYNLYAEYTYTKNGETINVKSNCINSESMYDAICAYDGKMTKVCFFRKPIRLIEDIIIEGDKQDFGRTIYFGKKMDVLEYNSMHEKKLYLPVDGYVFVCNNGEVITEFEPEAVDVDEVLNTLRKLQSFETSRKLS